jgi:hypothetical protein
MTSQPVVRDEKVVCHSPARHPWYHSYYDCLLLHRPRRRILGRMAVSPDTRDLCRSVFAPDLVELAVLALETYAGPEETWVHQAAIRLSDGRLHRLARWLNSAEREPETFRWYAGEPTDVSPESHRFAVDFINGLIDKDVSDPRAPR